jgi:hypothetical protein
VLCNLYIFSSIFLRIGLTYQEQLITAVHALNNTHVVAQENNQSGGVDIKSKSISKFGGKLVVTNFTGHP